MRNGNLASTPNAISGSPGGKTIDMFRKSILKLSLKNYAKSNINVFYDSTELNFKRNSACSYTAAPIVLSAFARCMPCLRGTATSWQLHQAAKALRCGNLGSRRRDVGHLLHLKKHGQRASPRGCTGRAKV